MGQSQHAVWVWPCLRSPWVHGYMCLSSCERSYFQTFLQNQRPGKSWKPGLGGGNCYLPCAITWQESTLQADEEQHKKQSGRRVSWSCPLQKLFVGSKPGKILRKLLKGNLADWWKGTGSLFCQKDVLGWVLGGKMQLLCKAISSLVFPHPSRWKMVFPGLLLCSGPG